MLKRLGIKIEKSGGGEPEGGCVAEIITSKNPNIVKRIAIELASLPIRRDKCVDAIYVVEGDERFLLWNAMSQK